MSKLPIFTELDLRLSRVKRWGVLFTIQQQSVAEHSYNVAIIALRIAQNWFDYDEESPIVLYDVLELALRHDRPESISGDISSTVKDLFDDYGVKTRYADLLSKREVHPKAIKIVALADRLEAVIFLRMEMSMGNHTVEDVLIECNRRMHDFIRNQYDKDEAQEIITLMDDFLEQLFSRCGRFASDSFDRRPRK